MRSLYSWQEQLDPYRDPPIQWKRAEEVVIDEYDLNEEHASWHDACTDDGEKIEIKSCACEYSDGRVGRFAVWESQWVELVTNGRFGLLVYVPEYDCTVLATKLISPGEIGSAGTVSRVQHPTMGYRELRRIPWPEVIDLNEIVAGKAHYFTEYYSEEEVTEMVFLYPAEYRESD